jgi:hypothetical protein
MPKSCAERHLLINHAEKKRELVAVEGSGTSGGTTQRQANELRGAISDADVGGRMPGRSTGCDHDSARTARNSDEAIWCGVTTEITRGYAGREGGGSP